MDINDLPKGGVDFRMEGISGFKIKLDSLIRNSRLSSLQNNRDQIVSIFEDLQDTIKHYGKISYSTRVRAYYRFANMPDTTKEDKLFFKKLLDNYK